MSCRVFHRCGTYVGQDGVAETAARRRSTRGGGNRGAPPICSRRQGCCAATLAPRADRRRAAVSTAASRSAARRGFRYPILSHIGPAPMENTTGHVQLSTDGPTPSWWAEVAMLWKTPFSETVVVLWPFPLKVLWVGCIAPENAVRPRDGMPTVVALPWKTQSVPGTE